MKLLLSLFFATLLQINANLEGNRSKNITLDLKSATVLDVIREIETTTDYRFLYRKDQLDTSRKMDIRAKNEKLERILQKVFGNSGIAYKVVQKQIVLTPNDEIQEERDFPKNGTEQEQHSINGTVSDAQGPMPGVSIYIKNSDRGTFSDAEGKYQIMAAPSDILIFSYIGYKSVERTVGNQTVINVELQEDVTELNEVVLNAGYYTTTEKERTGNISQITSQEIKRQPVSNPLAAMQGQMAGLNIQQSTGLPGGAFQVRIRGQNSIRENGNEPLYIIDGVPYSSQGFESSQTSSVFPGNNTTNPLNNINPSDIESIEVLKDADATSIYGSRGANGVILITTKKGRESQTEFNIRTSTGVGMVTRKMDLMNTQEYLEMRKEAYANDGITEYPTRAYDLNGTWDQNRFTDWQDELIGGTAYRTNIQGTLSGGSAQTQFVVSGGYLKETTVFPGDFAYTKGSVHTNLNHQSKNQKFGMSLSANYVSDRNNLMGTDLTRQALTLAPNAPALFTEDGQLNWANSSWNNPLSYLEVNYLAKTNNLISNMVMDYEVLPGVELRTNLGYNSIQLTESKTTPSTFFNPAFGLGSEAASAYFNTGNQQSWIVEPQINWNQKIGNGKLQVLAGTTFQEHTQDQIVHFASGFSSDALIHNMSAAQTIRIQNDYTTKYRYNAIYGRINYNWNGKYILNLTARRDGSSRFGPGKQFTNFGAVGAAWIFSDEKWAREHFSFLSFGKLRGSYGTTGSDQIGNYQFLDTYQISSTIYNGISGLRPGRLYNPNFSWEVNKKIEGAIELSFFKNRIQLNTAYYHNRSSNQLVGIPLPGTSGFTSIQANLPATVQNTGWEFELNSVNFQNKFRWTTGINLTIPKNKLVDFPELESSTYANQLVIGEPLQVQKVYQWEGVNPETGIYEFKDFNGDGFITSPEDRQALVHLAPKFFGGASNSFSYKGWQVDVLFQFVKQTGINYLFTSGFPGGFNNKHREILNHWQQDGDRVEIQRYTSGTDSQAIQANSNFQNSTGAFTDASFIRLKNLSISYLLPKEWGNGFDCRLFLLGQNMFTITNYLGIDPENQSTSSVPPLKIFSVGVELTF
ncbi:SusC/RagA family TonB-linked outer membrane protein [Flagellimonas sp.]|uniref:SusC/RagA family TonB-linked outer membrane protein n=1 Tax=Flagellimonas sp. TaxID=2058762 RepID=UPI003AB69E55